jgi:hypothetical protein
MINPKKAEKKKSNISGRETSKRKNSFNLGILVELHNLTLVL